MDKIRAGLSFNLPRVCCAQVLEASEHATIPLPPGVITPGGGLDVYEDVLKYFQVSYKSGAPHIQIGRYVGFIPLNKRFALNVTTRVPIGNIERLMGIAIGCEPLVLSSHLRSFKSTNEAPTSFVDLIAAQLLSVYGRIWRDGLLTHYERIERVGLSPAGCVNAFSSARLTQRRARPTASYLVFKRTSDIGPNRVLKLAVDITMQRLLALPEANIKGHRIADLQKVMHQLSEVTRGERVDVSSDVMARYISLIPQHHSNYVDALLLSDLIIANRGLSIREHGGQTVFNTLLVDMEKVFEEYARRCLSKYFGPKKHMRVLDGNVGGEKGAKVLAFETVGPQGRNSAMTPDIVLIEGEDVRLVIDVKYKPNQGLPDRSDLNQILGYSIRYRSERVMLLYPLRTGACKSVQFVGTVGRTSVFTGHIDLSEPDMKKEEDDFCCSVESILMSKGGS